MRLGMSYTEAMNLPTSERRAWLVTLGTAHGGEWSFAERKWIKPPQVM